MFLTSTSNKRGKKLHLPSSPMVTSKKRKNTGK